MLRRGWPLVAVVASCGRLVVAPDAGVVASADASTQAVDAGADREASTSPSNDAGEAFDSSAGDAASDDGAAGDAALDARDSSSDTYFLVPESTVLGIGDIDNIRLFAKLADGGIYQTTLTTPTHWTSSRPDVMTVSDFGQVIARGPGTATITAEVDGHVATVELTATNVLLKSLEVTPSQVDVPVSQSVDFTAKGSFADGTTRDMTASVGWSAEDAAQISDPFIRPWHVTAAALGFGNISVSWHGVHGGAGLRGVPGTLQSLQIDGPTTLPVYADVTLSAVATYSGGSQDETTHVAWSIDDPALGAFEEDDLEHWHFIGKRPGQSQIRVTLDGQLAVVPVTVTNAALTGLRISPDPIVFGHPALVAAALGMYNDGIERDVLFSTTWSTDNPGIAQILNASRQRGIIFTGGAGTTTVTAQVGPLTAHTTLIVPP